MIQFDVVVHVAIENILIDNNVLSMSVHVTIPAIM